MLSGAVVNNLKEGKGETFSLLTPTDSSFPLTSTGLDVVAAIGKLQVDQSPPQQQQQQQQQQQPEPLNDLLNKSLLLHQLQLSSRAGWPSSDLFSLLHSHGHPTNNRTSSIIVFTTTATLESLPRGVKISGLGDKSKFHQSVFRPFQRVYGVILTSPGVRQTAKTGGFRELCEVTGGRAWDYDPAGGGGGPGVGRAVREKGKRIGRNVREVTWGRVEIDGQGWELVPDREEMDEDKEGKGEVNNNNNLDKNFNPRWLLPENNWVESYRVGTSDKEGFKRSHHLCRLRTRRVPDSSWSEGTSPTTGGKRKIEGWDSYVLKPWYRNRQKAVKGVHLLIATGGRGDIDNGEIIVGMIKGDGVGARARIVVGGDFWKDIKIECKGAEKVPRKEGREVSF
jgi:hypothetical protein